MIKTVFIRHDPESLFGVKPNPRNAVLSLILNAILIKIVEDLSDDRPLVKDRIALYLELHACSIRKWAATHDRKLHGIFMSQLDPAGHEHDKARVKLFPRGHRPDRNDQRPLPVTRLLTVHLYCFANIVKTARNRGFQLSPDKRIP